jgi:hypothetical protein
MKTVIILLSIICIVFIGCIKDTREPQNDIPSSFSCTHTIPTRIPPPLYDYSITPISEIQYNQSHCGFLPLGKNNYWVFYDSIFDFNNGQFLYEALDTLRFKKTYTFNDSIIWWGPPSFTGPFNVNNSYKGYFQNIYSTDSNLYTLAEPNGARAVIKWAYPASSDTVSGFFNWSDVPGIFQGVAIRLTSPVIVPAGTFTDCILFIKKGIPYDHLQLYNYYKPGLGIVKSIVRKTTFPSSIYSPGHILSISTLRRYHIE